MLRRPGALHPLASPGLCIRRLFTATPRSSRLMAAPCAAASLLLAQVRILVADAGLQLTSLKRTRIGGLRLPPSLKRGGYQ